MKKLTNILPDQHVDAVHGSTDITINGLSLDSRQVKSGFLFAALPGTALDGMSFIAPAISAGANCIIAPKMPEDQAEGVTYIISSSPSKLLALIASNFYNKPSEKLELIGVTGTNGKTTVTTLLYRLFRGLGYKVGLISTTGILINEQTINATHTTPDAIRVNALLNDMVEADCDFAFMEVSSHAVVQDRVYGLNFRGGIFTNLTHDHLDYHKTFENYRDAKKGFFDSLDNEAFALVNADDKNGKFMQQNTKALRTTFALKNPADFKAKILEYDIHGMLLEVDGEELYSILRGKFNAYNLLAVYATAKLLDITHEELMPQLSLLSGVEGRFTFIQGKEITGVVDYAHTPDALENILTSIKDINIHGGRIITVVGCGGNRDRSKRPVMAKIASELSDKVILTSDNPRNEEPEDILHEMEEGLPIHKRKQALTIIDRKQAIKTACALSEQGDIIVVAGKGHEKYQEINGVKYPFDDQAILAEFLKEMDK